MRRHPLDIPAVQVVVLFAAAFALLGVYLWRTGGL